MKKFLPLLVLSVVANAALVLAVVNRTSHWIHFSAGAWYGDGAAAPTGGLIKENVPAADAVDPHTWSDLANGDLATVVARLRAAGYPPALQRAILGALITARFADRHKALADLISAHAWWQGNLYGSADGAKIITLRQQIAHDEKAMREQLLGPDPAGSELAHAQQVRQFGDLPVDKMSELSRISSDYDELLAEVRTDSQGILLPEDREKLAYLEQEKRADIVKLLSPDELLAYDMRSSPTAQQLKYQLSAFKPTEAEYTAIFPIAQSFNAQYNGGDNETMTAAQRQQRNAALASVVPDIQAVLTPERATEFKEKTDPAYIQTDALVTRLQLPDTTTAEVVAVQKDYTTRATAIRSDQTLTPDERTVAYNVLGAQATATLAPALGGDAGIAAYKQTGAGGWLNNLTRPPAPVKH
jgi:hypothetical protein